MASFAGSTGFLLWIENGRANGVTEARWSVSDSDYDPIVVCRRMLS
jgi:hypothetical protein